jgi:TRAP-type C4-dicarboxylate transport system permease large subunit
MGVWGVFGIGLVKRRMTGRALLASLWETAITSAAVFMLVIGCMIFGKFLALSGYTEVITKAITDLQLPDFGLFILLVIFYIVLGCFLEGISMMALTIPLILPIALSMGWNPIWFGIVIVKVIEIAQVTPPVGLNLYAMKSAAPDVEMTTIFMGCIPFWLCDVAVLVLLYFIPQLPLWLPGLMRF